MCLRSPSNTPHNNATLSTSSPPTSLPRPFSTEETPAPDPDDPATLLASLEAESPSSDSDSDILYPPALREARAQKLAEELRHARQYVHPSSQTPQSLIQPLTTDAATLNFTTQIPRCIVHFSHPDFSRCGTMDTHLQRLSVRHADEGVKFGKVDVRAAPFVVEKLGVRVLPCVVGFRDGVAVGRVVGFEGLGGGDEGGVEVTRRIEGVGVKWGVLGGRTKGWGASDGGDGGERSSGEDGDEDEEVEGQRWRRGKGGGLFGNGGRGIQGEKKGGADDDDDDEWD